MKQVMAHFGGTYSLFVLLGCITVVIHGFLFDECDAPLPCTCQVSSINCASLRLPRIPDFNLKQQYGTLYLYLQNNNVIVVPPDSFVGITSSSLYLDLSGNNIYDIHPLAFDGVEDKITILKLTNNHLHIVPPAIANLSRIISLDLSGNPITAFDSNVFRKIANSLEILSVGSPEMNQWDYGFEYLTRLRSLKVSNASIDHLPKDAFASYNETLKDLVIEGTRWKSIPQALCDLANLNNFKFDDNTDVTNNVLPSCVTPLTNVESFTLDKNNLSGFPDVFRICPNLVTLSVKWNPNMTSFEVGNMSTNSNLLGLYLTGNGYTSVPQEIGNFTNLETLDLSSNFITSILDTDFEMLSNLRDLRLNSNPLHYVNSHAFSNLTHLREINLDSTRLDGIPEALQYSRNQLRLLDFRFNKVNCTCGELDWVRNWTAGTAVDIRGTCSAPHPGESIQDFVSVYLPKC